MPNHWLPQEIRRFMDGTDPDHYAPGTATFYVNIVVGSRGGNVYQATWDTYGDVLATSGLFEYVGPNYTPDKPLFALHGSGGHLTPVFLPGALSYPSLGLNTAGGGANMLALAVCRQLGGAPATTDKLTWWIEDGISYDATTGQAIFQNGGDPDFDVTWPSVFCASNVVSDFYYNSGLEDLYEGAFDWVTATQAANQEIYMNFLVGNAAINYDPTNATVQDVLNESGITMYSATGYVANVIVPPMQVATEGSSLLVRPVTRPWTQTYTQLWENNAGSLNTWGLRDNLWGILISRKVAPPAINYAADRAICLFRSNISLDPDDGTHLRVQGTRTLMRVQFPNRFAGMNLT